MKKIFYSLSAVLATLPFALVAHATTISMNIPGTAPNSSSTPGAFVANFYQFALMIAGVLAFGVIVYGGVKYMTSAGNPSGQGDAKEWIEAALLGLLLLVGAYFILNVVNPQLTNLALPPVTPVKITAAPTTGSGGVTGQQGIVWCNSTTDGQCKNAADGSAQTCVNQGGSYSCQSTGVKETYTCGHPAYGTCPPTTPMCLNKGYYYCGVL